MKIKCWGSRGSVPVSGKGFVKYGGDTTCLEIRTRQNDTIIIDAGTGLRQLGNQLLQEKRFEFSLIFTHAHWDHLLGFPYFKPLYRPETRLTVFRCPFPKSYVEKILKQVLAPPYFPVKYDDLKARITFKDACPEPFEIGSVFIEPIALSHPNRANGYKITEDGKSFVFMTDNELEFKHPGSLDYEEYVSFAADADILFHDAEYTETEYREMRGWGHSTYNAAAQLAMDARVKQLGLFHLNQDRNDQDMDKILKTCEKIFKTQQQTIKCYPVKCGFEIDL